MSDSFNTEANKARQKESVYRNLYTSLLRRKRDVFQELSDVSNNKQDGQEESEQSDPFVGERQQIQKIFQTEVVNLCVGVGVTAVTFATLRFYGRNIIRRIGGRATPQQLEEADANAKKLGTHSTQNLIGMFLEGSFALWLGFRGYNYASHQSQNSYDLISEIPLCKGRSRISEALCPEWIEITKNQIPKSFFDIHDQQGSFREERTWTAIRQFSANCEKRNFYEQRLRTKKNIPSDHPIVLSNKVPKQVFQTDLE